MSLAAVENEGLYRREFEHDACGIGFRAHIKGRNHIRSLQMPSICSKGWTTAGPMELIQILETAQVY